MQFQRDMIEKNTIHYPDLAGQVKFLLGGIGTGNISIGSRGQFCDFEIFNYPNHGCKIPYTFFAMRSQVEGQTSDCRVLEAAYRGPFETSNGFSAGDLSGLPRFAHSDFSANYPFAHLTFQQDSLPFAVEAEAFTPFIPLNADDSGIPGFVMRYTVRNLSEKPADVSICGSLSNVCGFLSYDNIDLLRLSGDVCNETVRGPLNGVFCTSHDIPQDDYSFGTLALTTPDQQATIKTNWVDGGWWDGAEDLWRDLLEDGLLEEISDHGAIGSQLTATGSRKVGSVCINHHFAPGESYTYTFYFTWSFPNRYHGWEPPVPFDRHPELPVVRNYYAKQFPDALAAAKYLNSNLSRLESDSRKFADALYSSTLDPAVIDALAGNITVLRSPTCFRIENGTFFGWEGCKDHDGCCRGSCTHVWNYEQTLAFLFPELERTMQENSFENEVDEQGSMAFRSTLMLDGTRFDMLPATDGQLGCLIRLYRDWKLCGDDDYLRRCWPGAVRALNFAFSFWDADGDFVLDSRQHNTYDIEFYGPNSLTNSIFFAALKAGAIMAEHLGDTENRDRWQAAWKAGSEKMDAMLWNGEYYVQRLEDVNQYKYQVGIGCLSDQLLGQELAHISGLDYILPQEHVQKAVSSIYRYNFKRTFEDHHSVQRGYAFNNEQGLVLCSWPQGERPEQPFVYCDEIWTGVEYQVASHLIFEGYVEEGLEVVRAVRARQDGFRRNPFDEIECGRHYARSMASWGVLIALSGYRFDLTKKEVSFAPKQKDGDFSCFFSSGTCWGVYTETENGEKDLHVLYGDPNISLK